jgi:hypothetical protein
VEETVQTDTVDLFRPNDGPLKKSPGWAMAQSILLPGLGHQYMGMENRAIPYFAAEALFVFGAIFCENYSSRLYGNSHLHAFQYAGLEAGTGANELFWQNVGQYLDADGYNAVQELNRTPEYKIIEPNLQWSWVDEKYMKEYRAIRETGTKYHIASTFFLGAMILDRVIAFVDIRATTKFARTRHASSLSVVPQVSADFSASGARLTYRF